MHDRAPVSSPFSLFLGRCVQIERKKEMKAKIEKKRIDKETSIKPGADWWIVEFEKLRAFLGSSFFLSPPPFSPSFSSSLFPLYERRYRRVCEGAGKKNKKIKIKFGNPPQGPIQTKPMPPHDEEIELSRDPAHIRILYMGWSVCVLPCCIPLYKSTSIFITQVNVRPSFLLVWILLRLFFFQSWLLAGHTGGPLL